LGTLPLRAPTLREELIGGPSRNAAVH
jgi:hypothetical protein